MGLDDTRITLYTTQETVLGPNTSWNLTTVPVNGATVDLELVSDVKAFYVTISRGGVQATSPVVQR